RAEAGQLDEAAFLAGRAVSVTAELPADPFLQGQSLLVQAHLQTARGDAAAARAGLAQIEKALTALPPHHPLRRPCDAARPRPARAVQLARQATRRIEQAGGERSPWLPGALRFLAAQLHQSGEFSEAESAYERAFDIQRRRDREHPDLAVTLRELAGLHLSRNNAQAAHVRFGQALEIRKAALGEKHP